MTEREDTLAQLCKLLEPFNTKGIALAPDTDISTDLNLDSVSVMDFVMEVEDHFNIDIPLNVLSETRTMSDLVKVVETRLAKG
jgi:acyl carrier protein